MRTPVVWAEDAPEALERARTRGRPALLYFMAPWDPACQRMDATAFHQPEVRAIWGGFDAIRINVDLSRNRDLCRSWQPGIRVPGFVVLGPDRSVQFAHSGELSAERLALNLVRGAKKMPERFRAARAQATRALAAGNVTPLRELAAQLHHAGETEWAAKLRLVECREHAYRYRWSLAAEAADLALRFTPDNEEAKIIRARALFRAGGTIEPETAERIEAWVAQLGRSDEALDRLVQIAEPAVDALMRELESGRGDRSQAAAVALGRIRNSRVLPDILKGFQDPSRRVPVRVRFAIAAREWADLAYLKSMVSRLDDRTEAVALRTACADGIARIGSSQGGLYGPALVEPLFRGLETDYPALTEACVAGIAEISENFDLRRLYPVMPRSRSACELFLRRAGLELDQDVTTEAATYLATYWDANASRFVWDGRLRRYIPRSR